MPTISLSREALANFNDAVQKEWILTNEIGGYASSTVLGMNTRKYHGLLVAAVHPPRDRRVLLEKLDEDIIVGNSVYQLGTNEFQDTVFPSGHRLLSRFELSLFPKQVYSLQDVDLEKTVFMPHGQNVTIAIYKVLNRSSQDVKIRVFPLANFRHFHSVTDKRSLMEQPDQKCENSETTIDFASPKSTLIIGATGGTYHPNERWVERLYYREEAKRGESCFDDWYQGGFFDCGVRAEEKGGFAVVAVADEKADIARDILFRMPKTLIDLEALFEREKQRRENYVERFYENKTSIRAADWLNLMILATESLVVSGADPERTSIIAGYPWFEDWGRDTFVSLPGLTLATGRFEEARRILLTFQSRFSRGLIPNFIPDGGEPAVYNSVDATLWYANAVFQYFKYTGDFAFVQEQLLETLKSIVESLVEGVVPNIRLDADGLLSHGPQLTWMDAVVDGQPVTPRAGKAVEVQALWYNALRIMELLAGKLNEDNEAENYAKMAEKTRMSLVEKFWNVEKECLFDVVEGDRRDYSLRPNQIMAVSLDFTAFDQDKSKEIVDLVHRELWTPFGLRSLAKSDPKYVGICAGDRRSRDLAYHNGTVWPWLLGPFTTAYLKVNGYDAVERDYAYSSFLAPFFTRHVAGTQLGTASEIFDGDPPHKARGCILQAWSVAEPLRAYVEDVALLGPKR